MFKVYRLVLGAVFVLGLAGAAFSQGVPAKSGLIKTAAFFDEKAGITKLIAAEKQLNTEFATVIKELQDGNARLAKIVTELEQSTLTAANQAALQAKKEEGESLQRTLAYKKTNVENDINKRRQALIEPINFDIGKAISEYGKKNNFGAIYDANKLVENGVLLFWAENTDITKDFIAFYNARAAAVPIK